jgi:hypothetical protein
MHEVRLAWNGETYPTMSPIAEVAYHARGGKAEHLPGAARIPGGRADVRFGIDADGELYIMTKSDGVIRKVVGAVLK